MDQLIDSEAHDALVEKLHTAAREFRARPVEVDTGPPSTDDSVRSGARTDAPVPTPPFWGVKEIPVDLEEVYHHLDTHVLFKLHWGGRGKKGEEWRTLLREDFRRAWSGCGASRTICTRGRCSASSPATPSATTSSCSTPRTVRPSSRAWCVPARAPASGSAWPTSSAPPWTGSHRSSSTSWPCRR